MFVERVRAMLPRSEAGDPPARASRRHTHVMSVLAFDVRASWEGIALEAVVSRLVPGPKSASSGQHIRALNLTCSLCEALGASASSSSVRRRLR